MIQVENLTEEDGFIRFEVSGEYTPGKEMDEVSAVWTRVTRESRERGIDRVLALWHVPAALPTVVGYDIGSRPVDLFGWDPACRLAAVHDDQREEAQELYRFIEDVAHNRGLPFRAFDNEEEALTWLLET